MTLPSSTRLGAAARSRLRPTRQRLALARLLLENGERISPPSSLHAEATGAAIRVSLATVYNTLHQFTDAGLLREVVVEPGRSYFDTNAADHHHFFCEATGKLQDIPVGTCRQRLSAAASRNCDLPRRTSSSGYRPENS